MTESARMPNVTPPCFQSDWHYQEYVRLSKNKIPDNANFCWDCNPEYQREAWLKGDCNHQETIFIYKLDGGRIMALHGLIEQKKESRLEPVTLMEFRERGYWYSINGRKTHGS